jgi:hypothetical protein
MHTCGNVLVVQLTLTLNLSMYLTLQSIIDYLQLVHNFDYICFVWHMHAKKTAPYDPFSRLGPISKSVKFHSLPALTILSHMALVWSAIMYDLLSKITSSFLACGEK